MKKTLLTVALCSLTCAAYAEFPVGKVGINLAPKADIDSPNDNGDGNGFGLYGQFGSDTLFGCADYQKSRLDINGDNSDTKETRFGGGYQSGTDKATLVVRVENYRLEVEPDTGSGVDESGIGIHIGGDLAVAENIGLFGDVGYLSLDNWDGNEFRLGVRGKVTDTAEAYAAWRKLSLDDAGDNYDLSDLRVGINVLF